MIEQLAKYPQHMARLLTIKSKIYTVVDSLEVYGALSKEPVKKEDLDKIDFIKFNVSDLWAKSFDCGWFCFKGKIPNQAKGKHVVALINIEGEGVVYRDNEVQQGITQVLDGIDLVQSAKGKQVVELFNSAEGGEKIELYVDAGYNKLSGKARIRRKDVAICNDDILVYYYDYLTLLNLITTYGKNAELTKERLEEIKKALSLSYKSFVKKEYALAHEILSKEIVKPANEGCMEYTAIGHAHIDLAWLWPVRETKRKGVRTFATACHNMQKNPNYKFGASQAQLFQWVKEEAPSLYEDVKKYVKEERFEIQGGMWTENDCNIPSGESIIRQFLYGEKFFKDEFDKTCKVVWLPDVFGYPASLPQIMKKCGKDYFMTIKLSWNEHNKFPYKTFVWKGIDDTSVLAHMPPQGTYNSHATPISLVQSDLRNPQKDSIKDALLVYGIGDGGGGPGEAHIEMVNREKSIQGLPKVKSGFAVDFFEDLEKKYISVIPEYKGELYLEKHQGTYTSQARSKMHNRRIEEMLHTVEWLTVVAELNRIPFDKKKIDEIWKEVLLYQFHDIIPGSSIKRVYDESIKRYEVMEDELTKMRDTLLATLSTSQKLSAINTIDFDRKEFVKVDDKWYIAEVDKYSSSVLDTLNISEITDLKYGDDYISNSKLKVVFDEKGNIISCYDKVLNKELCKNLFNQFIIYTDPKLHYNAWDIKQNYRELKKFYPVLTDVKTYIDGPEIIREHSFKFNNSSIVQRIVLNSDDYMLSFFTIVDWQETLKMLRCEFEPTVFSDKVNCDIQFGNIDRSTKNQTSIEKAQYEICAHKFVNVDEDEYGVALINNCKYGHYVKDGVISLNLLRSPIYPDPSCDKGKQYFNYAFYPHQGLWNECDLVKRAYCFNNQLLVSDYLINLGQIVDVDNDNIIVETIKVAENAKGIVMRLYERYGEPCVAKVKVGFKFKGSYLTNMLEEIESKIDNSCLAFTPYEIKTLYFELVD